jgi:hypothetical protein
MMYIFRVVLYPVSGIPEKAKVRFNHSEYMCFGQGPMIGSGLATIPKQTHNIHYVKYYWIEKAGIHRLFLFF